MTKLNRKAAVYIFVLQKIEQYNTEHSPNIQRASAFIHGF